MAILRAIVAFDETLLGRVFQPVLDRFAWLHCSRYRLAAAPINLAAFLCVPVVAIAVGQAHDPVAAVAEHGGAVACLVLGLLFGRFMIVRARTWDGVKVRFGGRSGSPNRFLLRPYRLAMLALGVGCLVASGVSGRAGIDLVFTAYVWALVVSAYLLSCENPPPAPWRRSMWWDGRNRPW